MGSSAPITVVGAGVIGLSTAVLIQQRHPARQITIVAAELPSLPRVWLADRSLRPSPDYASMWAGAHFRPIPFVPANTQLADERAMCTVTHRVMSRIAEDHPDAGVQVMSAAEVYDVPPPEYLSLRTGDEYAAPGDGFRIMEPHQLERYGARWGCEYTSYCVNVHLYTCWLLERFREAGGVVVQRHLSCLQEAYDLAGPGSVVVNCSGRNFDQDPKMKVIRGQTVLVRQQYHRTITKVNGDGTWSFLIPRPSGGGTVVGGTKEIGVMDEAATPGTRASLLANAVKYFPDFVAAVENFQVVTDNVGRRPWREGGMRIETQQLRPGQNVVHGYGAGGRGFELSWGAAQRVADLVDQAILTTALARL